MVTSRDVVVAELWRYPVKSMQGERLPAVNVHADGLDGDRRWGVRDELTGRVLTGRREARLLEARASLGEGAEPVIQLPDGTALVGVGDATDTALSDWLGRPVRLVEAAAHGDRAEYFADPTDDASEAIEWTMPPERFVDAMPLLLMTTASLRAGAALHPAGVWDVRRFRPNVLLDASGDGWLEDDWCGRVVRVGEVEVVPQQPCIRCTMVTRSQPGLTRDLDVYRTLARHTAATSACGQRYSTAARSPRTTSRTLSLPTCPDDRASAPPASSR